MKKQATRKSRRDPNVYPAGWDYARTKAVADYYDGRKDEAVLDEPSVTRASVGLVWMEVPQDLVPKVRKLIAQRRKSA
ncbi:MAG TPA: hypothetical protein VH370_05185 [Humisphaera sp.]|jgi:hypothetical protein|nr:hypothetical protein [Humisphaera sp.]